MGVLRRQLPWASQPQGPTKADAASPLNRNLRVHYPLSVWSGERDNASGYVGTFNNAPSLDIGVRGYSRKFVAASSQSVSVASNSLNDISGIVTMSAWVFMDAWPPKDAGAEPYGLGTILAKGYNGTTVGYYLDFYYAQTGIKYVRAGSYSSATDHGVKVEIGDYYLQQWIYVSATHDGSGWRLYVNGALVASNSDTVGAVSVSTRFTLGCLDLNGTLARFFSGKIQEARVQAAALSAAEHAESYRRNWSLYQPLTRNIWVASAGGAAALTGTITTANEGDIVTGGKTIILTLTGDTWVASGATFDAQRQNIINGLTSAQSEGTGWNAVVKAGQAVTGVVRTSDTVVTITLDAFATYNITSAETITATIPSTAVSLGAQIVSTPTFQVTATTAGGWLNRNYWWNRPYNTCGAY